MRPSATFRSSMSRVRSRAWSRSATSSARCSSVTSAAEPGRVQHVVAPLGPDHQRAVHDLVEATGIAVAAPCQAHVTLVSHEDLVPEAAIDALRPVAAATPPLVVRAHGYGFFTG